MLQELLKNERIERVVEIGTWKGGTALIFAMMVSKYENGIVYCIDWSFEYGFHNAREPGTGIPRSYHNFYRESKYSKHVKELQGNSHDPAFIEKVKNEVGPESVDFMFIDGDHTYEGVKADFLVYHSLVKPGGYIGFHDIRETAHHISIGCNVAPFWEEIKNNYEHWEFIDSNIYPGWEGEVMPSKCMGIGVIKKPK